MALLTQFLLRLSFGLALGMAITSPKRVTSGYFRNHLYVTLGLTTLAALVSYSAAPEAFWYAVAAAVFSYVGSVCWLYEKVNAGSAVLLIVFGVAVLGAHFQNGESIESKFDNDAFLESRWPSVVTKSLTAAEWDQSIKKNRVLISSAVALFLVSPITSGLLLGMTMAAMLLGHWYLNSPTMELAPLKRLILVMGAAVALQAVVSLLGLWGEIASGAALSTQWILFVVLRWTFGLLGVGVLAWMAWQTLKIPNTQSATGILYVAVIGTFVGETMALLLSAESLFPL